MAETAWSEASLPVWLRATPSTAPYTAMAGVKAMASQPVKIASKARPMKGDRRRRKVSRIGMDLSFPVCSPDPSQDPFQPPQGRKKAGRAAGRWFAIARTSRYVTRNFVNRSRRLRTSTVRSDGQGAGGTAETSSVADIFHEVEE